MKKLFFGLLFLAGFFSSFYLLRADDVVKLGEGEGRTFVGDKTITGDLLVTGDSVEVRNASYKVFMSTVSGGTEYVTFTPSSATFRQGLYVGSGSGFFLSNAVGSEPGFFTFTTPGNVPTITAANNGITLISAGGGATENINFNTTNVATMALFGSGGLALGRTSVATDPGLNNMLIDGDLQMISGGSLTSTANGDITFTPNGTGDVNWTSQNSTMTTAGALTTGGLLTVPNITLGSQGVITGSIFGVIPSSAITNSTSEITLYSTTINANVLGANGCIHVNGQYSQTGGTANNKTIRLKFGGTTFNSNTFTTQGGRGLDNMICNTATNAQKGWNITSNANTDELITGSIDTTSNQTLLITGQLAVATDTATWNHGFLEVLK